MPAGQRDKRVTIRRRATQATNPGGVPRGGYADAFTLWGRMIQSQGHRLVEGAIAEDATPLAIRFRDCEQARSITVADRAVILGRECAIISAGMPDRRGGFVDILISTQRAG